MNNKLSCNLMLTYCGTGWKFCSHSEKKIQKDCSAQTGGSMKTPDVVGLPGRVIFSSTKQN